MAAEWHYSKDGKQHGPVTASDLKNLAKSGVLLPTDLIRKEGMAEWTPASNAKGLFSGIPRTNTGSPGESIVTAQQAVQSESIPKTITKQSLVEAAKGAAQYTAKQAERTKLINLALPPLYQALGRQAFSTSDFRAEFAELFQQLEKVQLELSENSAKPIAEAKGFGDKAKALAGQAMQSAQAQKLSLRQSSLFGSLGKAVYDKHQDASGPKELVKPISDTLARIELLDSDLNALSTNKDGSWITPKRMAISVGATACVMLLIFFLMARGGSASYTQRILDLTDAQKKEFGVSVPKGAKPLFSPGSTEDFVQSLTMFKVAGQIGSFNNHITLGDGSRVWGDTDSLNGIAQHCKIQFGGGINMKSKCWDMIYGSRNGLETIEETVSYGGTMSPGKTLIDRWLVNCTDGVVVVRGHNRNVPLIKTKKDEILVMFVHFDEPYKSIFPPGDRSGGVVSFKY